MADTVDADRDHLHTMGYAQELHRGMSTFSNFAISFSIISILAGGMTSFWLGMVTGGPVVITLGWIIVGFFALLVGMSMGEICSAYPTAGGLYYWSAKLARKNHARWSWFTGYFNLIGQIGVIASVDYALAIFTGYFIRMFDDTFKLTSWTIFGIYLIILVVHAVLNTFSIDLVKILGDISVWWHVVGVVIIASFLFIAPTNKRGIGGAFDGAPAGLTGWTGGLFITVYLFGLGLLLAQYTITGFDASAHVSEETVGARTEAPKAIVRSIYISAVAALVMNLAMIAALPKKGALLADGKTDAYGAIAFGGGGDTFLVNAAPRLISSALGTGAAKLLVFIALVGQFFCGLASVTANSRMIYAFSRDGALPGSNIWHKINKKTRTPTNSVWLGVGLSAIVGSLSLYQKGGFSTAFFVLTGICVIGLYIAYAIPIYLRLTNPDFQTGPWNLKGHHKVIGWTALAWVVFISVLFVMPVFWPFWPIWGSKNEYSPGFFRVNNFNFTGPLILLGAIFVLGYWRFSGKKWFTGPKVQGTKEELLAIERELDAVEHGRAVPAGLTDFYSAHSDEPAFGPARSRYRRAMELHPALKDAIDAGVHGHLVTINPDGSPQVTVVWLGRDADEVLVAHLGSGQKVRNLVRDPRLTISFELPGTSGVGLVNYAVLHGTARITDGGAPELLQELAFKFMGAGVKFPPMDDPPPGRIVHMTVDRVTGMGPWAG